MPRPLPKYRRHPNGQAFVQYQGKRHYLGKYDTPKSKSRYAQFIERLNVPNVEPDPVVGGDKVIVELVVLYQNFAQGYYSKATADGGRVTTKEYGSMVEALRPLDTLFGEMLGRDFRPKHLGDIQRYMISQKLARTVINRRIGRIKRFFKWCCKEGHLPETLYHGLTCVDGLRKGRSGARETKPVAPVPREVVDATLPYLTPVVSAMVQMQLLCGMRPAEVCIMRPCDIDRSGDIWLYRPSEHKNDWRDQERFVAIPKVAQAILEPFLDRDPEAFLFSPKESEEWRRANRPVTAKEGRKTPIYPSELRQREQRKKESRKKTPKRPKRDRYDTASYRRAITYALKKAKNAKVVIPHWHPHQLRHAISTEISQAIGEQAAQRWLGHARLETTGIYTQAQVKEVIEIAKALDQKWAG